MIQFRLSVRHLVHLCDYEGRYIDCLFVKPNHLCYPSIMFVYLSVDTDLSDFVS